jgi:hypothetical protein
MRRSAIAFALLALLPLSAAFAQSAARPLSDPARASAIPLIEEIKRADYEGDRSTLKRLHSELRPPAENKLLISRFDYWRGFALWRRAINGFNDNVPKPEQEDDLNAAIADFNDSVASDPAFVEPKIAAASCYGYLYFLNLKDPAHAHQFIEHSSPLLKEVMASDPDNPRLLWVLGPIRWSSPPERGGGQDKAFDLYNRGLEVIRRKPAPNDPLEPSWGEPELLMNRAWSNLNRSTPDLASAQKDAEAALALVPYWHYVKDILMPQIEKAQTKPRSSS